jgi:hypothetical protein
MSQTLPPGAPGTPGLPEPVLPPTEPDVGPGPERPDIHPQPEPSPEPDPDEAERERDPDSSGDESEDKPVT